MAVDIGETVKAGVVFSGNKITPKWFIWTNKKYDVKSVNYTWKTKSGRSNIQHFAVSDGTNVFELAYDTESAKWELVSVET